MIYFIETVGNPYVKIGFTYQNMSRRIISMQIGCPLELRVAGVMNGGKEIEARIHIMFSSYRIRGEWFFMSKCIKRYIKKKCVSYKTYLETKEADLSYCPPPHPPHYEVINLFISEMCIVGEEYKEKMSDIYPSYIEWCKLRKVESVSVRRFGTVLSYYNFNSRPSNGDTWKLGIKLRPL